MGEQSTTSHDVDQSELGLDGSEAFLGQGSLGLLLDNLNAEQIIGIAFKALVAVCRDLVLPVGFGDRGSHVVRVKAAEGRLVVETEDRAINNVVHLWQSVPCQSSVERLAINTQGLSLVLQDPNVVVVLVGIQSDLLLQATGRVHEGVRVEVATLSVDMADGNSASHDDVGSNVLHTLAVQRSLEFRAHESITLTRVGQAKEVNGEHGEIEGNGDDDEAEDSGHEVLEPETLH